MIVLEKETIRIDNAQLNRDQFGYIQATQGLNPVLMEINMKKCGHFCKSSNELNRCCLCTQRQGWFSMCGICEIHSKEAYSEVSKKLREVMNATRRNGVKATKP